MQDDKRTDRKTINPVIDQKIIKNKHSRWLIYLLSALLALILIFLFINHNKKETSSAPPETVSSRSVTETNSSKSVAADNKQSADSSATATDRLNAWFTGDKSKDSEWVALDHVNFDSGSATPAMNDTKQLQDIADILNKHPDSKALIRGFADASGPQAYNDKLSEERANSVRNWLVGHDVKPERISIDGQGASDPVASNATEQGREMNRRVALKILAGKAGE